MKQKIHKNYQQTTKLSLCHSLNLLDRGVAARSWEITADAKIETLIRWLGTDPQTAVHVHIWKNLVETRHKGLLCTDMLASWILINKSFYFYLVLPSHLDIFIYQKYTCSYSIKTYLFWVSMLFWTSLYVLV